MQVIAGHSHGVAGTVQRPLTAPLVLDIHLSPGARFEHVLPAGHHGFVGVYRGHLSVCRAGDVDVDVDPDGPDAGAIAVPQQSMAVLAQDNGADGVGLNAGTEPTRALPIASAPLDEPIAQYDPFVMNTRDDRLTAVQDFQAGRLD